MRIATILPEKPVNAGLKKRWVPAAMATPLRLDPAMPRPGSEPRQARRLTLWPTVTSDAASTVSKTKET